MSSHVLPEGFSDFDMFVFGSVLLVGGLLGFFLNFISILAFLKVKQLRTPSNFFVFSLALADLGLSCNGLTSAYASYLRFFQLWLNCLRSPTLCCMPTPTSFTEKESGSSSQDRNKWRKRNRGPPQVLPVVAKLSPFSNALLYAYANEFYREGIWQFLTGQKQMEKKK
ncbi:retinal G protein coupled receptor b [Silurus asotus]|uniref:Retinal G protein coupled receptor b n=1 Tax=Silurus asotus TaxID=30991 RepID=A0AAD4ZYX3_SILAS|nr:retinal G protein coupled receptor b [Silurus asotus]